MKKLSIVAVFALVGIAVPNAWGQDEPTKPERATEVKKTETAPAPVGAKPLTTVKERREERLLKTLKTLNKPIESVNWEGETFGDLLEEYFKKQQGMDNILVLWKVIESGDSGVAADSEVNLTLTNTTVAEVLDEVLEYVSTGASTDSDKLTYYVIGGMVRIAPKSYFNRKLFVRAYDITSCVVPVPMFNGAPQVSVNNQNQQQGGGGQGGSGGGGSGQSIFGGSSGGGGGGSGGSGGSGGQQQDYAALMDTLRDAVKEVIKSINPETWDDGGGPGKISDLRRGQLVITQTIEMHEKIGGMFGYTGKAFD